MAWFKKSEEEERLEAQIGADDQSSPDGTSTQESFNHPGEQANIQNSTNLAERIVIKFTKLNTVFKVILIVVAVLIVPWFYLLFAAYLVWRGIKSKFHIDKHSPQSKKVIAISAAILIVILIHFILILFAFASWK